MLLGEKDFKFRLYFFCMKDFCAGVFGFVTACYVFANFSIFYLGIFFAKIF